MGLPRCDLHGQGGSATVSHHVDLGALGPPPIEAVVHRLPGAEPFGQIALGRAGVEDPEPGVDHRAVVAIRPAVAPLGRQ